MDLGKLRKIPTAIWLGVAVIGLAIFTAYWPAMHGEFLWDDAVFLTNNPLIQNAHGLWKIWFSTQPVDYFPLTNTWFWVEWRLWGTSPWGYHLVNVALHFAACLLLWGTVRKLGLKNGVPFLSAMLFAMHPVNVMSVAWISELKNTLSMVLYLLAMWLWIKSVGDADNLRKRRIAYGLSLLFFVLALLAKTSVVMLPVVMLIVLWWMHGRIGRRNLLLTAPFFLASLLAGLTTFYFQNQGGLAEARLAPVGWAARIARVGWVFWFYVYKAAWPIRLRVIYPAWKLPVNWLALYLPLLGIIVLGIALWRLRRVLGRGPLAALGYSFISILPIAGLTDMSFMWYSMVSDHLQYVAIIGIIVLGSVVLVQLTCFNQPAGIALAAIIICLFWHQTRSQAAIYRSEEVFWRSAVAGNPASAQAHYNLGCSLQRKNDLPAAITSYREAIRLEPRFTDAHNNLGLLLMRQRKFDAAVAELELTCKYGPDSVAYGNLGLALLADRRLDDAIAALYESVRLNAGDLNIRLELAAALAERNRMREAIVQARAAVQLNSNSINALNDLSWFLSSWPLATQKDRDEAVTFSEKACQLTNKKNPSVLDTLAMAYFADGQTPAAIATERQAIGLAQESSKSQEFLAQLDAHLNTFTAAQPTHRNSSP